MSSTLPFANSIISSLLVEKVKSVFQVKSRVLIFIVDRVNSKPLLRVFPTLVKIFV